MDYATIDDMKVLWRSMSEEESVRAIALIPIVCASLRNEAKKTGKNLDQMVSEDPDLLIVAKSVTVDVVARILMTSTDKEPMSQFSESALGYSASGTFLVPGGGLFIKRSELDRLGIKNKQKIRTIDMCGGTND